MNHIGSHIGPGLEASRSDTDSPRIVAFGGGKGGAGRSTLCAEVARSIARRDAQVFCLDADWNCPSLDTLLHLEDGASLDRSPSGPPIEAETAHIGDFARDTQTRGVELASIAESRRFPFVRTRLGPGRLIEQLHDLEADWVLVDLPPGFDPFAVGLFALADVPLLVSTPEPISVRKTTQFLRTGLFHAIGHHPEAPDVRTPLQELLYDQTLQFDVDTLLEDAPDELRAIVEESIERFEPYLTVNFVREGAEQDLGYVLCHAWHREIGIYPRFLTPVDYEDRRWFYHRRSTGADAVRGEETRSRDIEKLTQSLLDIDSIDSTYPRPIPRDDSIPPALRIGLNPDRNRNRIRQHCRRLWEGYGREDAVELVFHDTEAREHVTDELETLYREVLTLPSSEFNTVDVGEEEEETLEPASSPRIAHERDDRETPTPPAQTGTAASTPPLQPTDDAHASPRDARESAPSETNDTPSVDGEDVEPRSDETSSEVERGDIDSETSPADDSNTPPTSSSPDDPELDAILPADDAPPGRILEALRRRDDVSLQELSLRINVGIKYLTALEDGEVDVLPRPVYLRGYLQEIARFFDIEPELLIDAYFTRLDDPPELD